MSLLQLRWVKGVCVLGVTCHEMERTPNKSQHTKLTLEKKILPPPLPGFELATFRSRVRRFTNKLSRLPGTLTRDFVPTINETVGLKCVAHTAAHLNANSFWW